MDIKKFQTVHYYLKRSAHSSYIYMKMQRRRVEINTKLDKEFEEAANVERNVRDKLAIFPVSLNCYSYIHCVCYSSSSRHSQFLCLIFFFLGQGGSLFFGWAKLIFLLALLKSDYSFISRQALVITHQRNICSSHAEGHSILTLYVPLCNFQIII